MTRATGGDRTRGTSFVELMLAVSMIVGTILLIGQLGSVAVAWNDVQGRVVSVTSSSDRIRTSVRAALETGRPIAALGSWTSGPCLIVKTGDGHVVVDRAGGQLVARRLRGSTNEETVVLARHVTGAAFEVVKDAKGRARAVSWRVTVATGASATANIEGFAALRADEGGAP